MPPLIRIKLILNDTLEIFGIYDSGSNVSLINSKLLKLKNGKEKDKKSANLRTINGVSKTNGMVTVKAKIIDIEKKTNIFVVDKKNFKYDFLIGLDMIKDFRLIQNEDLKITQRVPDNKIEEYEINFNENIDEKRFNMTVNHLNCQQKEMIDKLIEGYKTAFAKDKYDIGTVKDYEARIDLLVDKYCCKRPYRCNIEDKREIEKQVANLLNKKLIEESYSPFAAPVTLAYKRDENKRSRLCIDFRELNKIVVPQSQPFPLIEDLIVKTRNCQFFTTLDINSAFWSIPIRIEDRHKTAFVTQEGHFQWTCLPFGLKTSPAIFQRILSNIIRKHKLTDFTVNYIDDILIFSKSFSEHMDHLIQLLEAIITEGFRLKFSKCTFASNTVKYLGHVIGNNSIRPLKDNLISIKNFPTPKTQKHIRQFLGKINYYNKYIPNVATTLDPLHNLLRKGQKFIWTEKCKESFERIKDLLCSQPVLEIFDSGLPIHIYTDASSHGIGAVLKQEQINGEKKPIAYFSKKLNEAQKKKKAIYLECLAIKEAVKYWQYWLMGKTFTVFSDHKPLENMNIKARTDEELGDLTYYLSQYDFQIRYSPGKQNLEADCLSRNPVLGSQENEDEQLRIVNLINIEEILLDQEKNNDLQEEKDKLVSRNNIYYKRTKKREKIVLSEDFSITFIRRVHENYCHIGIQQMEHIIGLSYTAKNLIKNIKKICKNCEICIRNKSRGQKIYGLMSHLGPARKPFEIMSIDTIGGLGGSRSTKKYLHLLVDHFTRYAYILTSSTQNSKDFIKLVTNVTKNNKIGMILTDRYPGINSQEFKKFLEEKKIPIIFTAINTPFSNGINERLNQTLINKIRCKMNEKGTKLAWTTIAQECIKKYNQTIHTVTRFAPAYLLEGKNITVLPKEISQENIPKNLLEDRELAYKNSIKSHEYNKKLFNKNKNEGEFKEGDSVFVENGNKLNRRKLEELRIGPYKILEKVSKSLYKVDTGHRKSDSTLFHITKLTPAPPVPVQIEDIQDIEENVVTLFPEDSGG